MRLPRILNQCHPIPGFVYLQASFAEDGQTILIPVRPRKRSTAICSGCHQPAPGYDQSRTPRRFEFIGFWGYLVFLVYCMRRVNCKQCGVLVEEVPWGMGKHTSTKVHMHFLGHWARKLSWKETAEEFRTTWDKVHDAVEYLVTWGLEHRVLGAIRAIGVDEIQRGKGHKYLTLVYQIDLGCTRLLCFLFVAAKIWRHAGRTGVSYSDHYEEKGVFERLMDRLRRIAPGAQGYAPVMVPALR